jgi:phosphate transport system permease protein
MNLTATEQEAMVRYRRRKRLVSKVFSALCLAATISCVLVLVLLLVSVASRGFKYLNWNFITGLISPDPHDAGVWVYLVGSVWLIGLTTLFSVPVGVGAAIYLEEYAADTRWKRLVQLNIANLAGVPSIVYGLLGLGIFVWALDFGHSVLSGALTLSLVVLPIVILSAQEALRAVPGTIRQASFALGATRWQTIWRQVLPAATPGIMTGVILAVARALGEAAPLVAMGAVQYIDYAPQSIWDPFSALPLAIFEWAGRPQQEFHDLSATAILLLLMVLVTMNMGAAYVRYRFGKAIRW